MKEEGGGRDGGGREEGMGGSGEEGMGGGGGGMGRDREGGREGWGESVFFCNACHSNKIFHSFILSFIQM